MGAPVHQVVRTGTVPMLDTDGVVGRGDCGRGRGSGKLGLMSDPGTTPPAAIPQVVPAPPSYLARAVSLIWLVISVVVGFRLIVTTRLATYGGDAYTGIQNAAAQTTVSVGWVVIGTGVIAFVIAWRR